MGYVLSDDGDDEWREDDEEEALCGVMRKGDVDELYE